MATGGLKTSHQVSLAFRSSIVGESIPVRRFQLPFRSHVDIHSLIRLVRIIRQEQINVLIPTKRKDYVLAGLAAKICGIHNILRLGIVRELRIPLFHKLIYNDLADGIIVNAEKIMVSLRKAPFMREANIKVIYNGLDTERIDTLSSHRIEKPFHFTVSALGTLTDRKGFDFLIRGFSRFVQNAGDCNAGLVIIGDGPKKEDLAALSEKMGVESRVLFTGFLHNPYPYLAASDVFAMTSTNEGISNALLEAMYLGNAPISTTAGGTDEAIRDHHNGFLLKYGDEIRLAESLEILCNNPVKRKQIAQNAAEQVKQQFSLNVMKQSLEGYLKEIAGEQ